MRSAILLSLLLFVGCAYKHIPIKGTYLTKPFEIHTLKSFDEAWNSTIDLFAQNGIAIKTIDRSSGLIISERTALSWTFENDEGKPVKPDAFVVIEKIIDPGPMRPVKPSSVKGDWNIIIRSNSDGTTKINVNLVNITAGLVYDIKRGVATETPIQAVSTGKFEQLIAEFIK